MPHRLELARDIVHFVELHWKQAVTVKEAAAKFEIDPADAERLFRKITGKSIAYFVREKRKEFVVSELRRGDLFAYELARELGYREEQSFTRWVKSTFGVSWTELCRRHRDGSASLPRTDQKSPPKSLRRSPPRSDVKE
jgi:methylphosphotriester-DNA--protein-cysteine methyltransferase